MRNGQWIAGVFGVVVAVLLAGCAGQSSPAQTLRVCSTGDYRPFTYSDAEAWSGMDIDLAHNLADSLGKKLELVQTTWAHLVDDLQTKCDMAMGGISVNPERAKRALYSSPYLRDGKAAIVRCADSAKYRSLGDIDKPGVRVVVNPGGGNAAFDKAHLHQAEVIVYPDNNTIFGQIVDGKADAMITDSSEIRWETMKEPLLCGVSVDDPFTSEQKAYLIRQNDPRLQRQVNDWLDHVHQDGTFARVTQQWLGHTPTP